MYYFQALLVVLEELYVNINFTAANMTISIRSNKYTESRFSKPTVDLSRLFLHDNGVTKQPHNFFFALIYPGISLSSFLHQVSANSKHVWRNSETPGVLILH